MDDKNKLVKPGSVWDISTQNQKQNIQKPYLNQGKLRSGSQTPWQQKVESAKQQADKIDPSTMPNRLVMMLDCSGSMAWGVDTNQGNRVKIELLKEAVNNFIARCNLSDTSIAIKSFPPGTELRLTTNTSNLHNAVLTLHAEGNTPMKACVSAVPEDYPLTRGIIVSDGAARDWSVQGESEEHGPDELLKTFQEMKVPIDTVHIGDEREGENLLKWIAKHTGGIYIKFTDVGAFAQAFAYLTPGSRALLTEGRVNATSLGAKEIERF
jgi:Mg-chelatase subunit ChlD